MRVTQMVFRYRRTSWTKEGGSCLLFWKTRFWDMGWVGRLGHVPTFWGWFWVRARNVAHVRPRSKNEVQKLTPKLKEIELWFWHHSIRLEKRTIKKKNVKIGWKMTEIFPLEGRAPKWQLAYFRPKVGYFGQMFWDMDFKFVLPIIYHENDGQTTFEVKCQSDLIWPFYQGRI